MSDIDKQAKEDISRLATALVKLASTIQPFDSKVVTAFGLVFAVTMKVAGTDRETVMEIIGDLYDGGELVPTDKTTEKPN